MKDLVLQILPYLLEGFFVIISLIITIRVSFAKFEAKIEYINLLITKYDEQAKKESEYLKAELKELKEKIGNISKEAEAIIELRIKCQNLEKQLEELKINLRNEKRI